MDGETSQSLEQYAEHLGLPSYAYLIDELWRLRKAKELLLSRDEARSKYQKHLDRLPITIDSLKREAEMLQKEEVAINQLDRKIQMVENLLGQIT